ncbi:MAG: lysylphosphatidylglycerol synthase transmembrane domain-containing protein [Chthoniobacterales bacterium]
MRGLVSLVLVFFIVRRVDWVRLGAVLDRLDVGLAVQVSGLTLLLIVLLAARWSIFLRQQSICLSFGKVLSLTWAGQFFNTVLPGSTGGDVVKIYQLCRMMPDQRGAAAMSVIVDRLSALIALALLVGFALAAGPARNLGSIGLSLWPSWVSLIVLATAIIAIIFTVKQMFRSSRWRARSVRAVTLLRTSLRLNWSLVAAVTLAFITHLVNFALFFFFARALGIGITPYQTLLVMPVVLLLVMLPLTINGHGLREVLVIFFFGQLQISLAGNSGIGLRETVIGLSVITVSNDILWSLPGGLWYLFRFRAPRKGQPEYLAPAV